MDSDIKEKLVRIVMNESFREKKINIVEMLIDYQMRHNVLLKTTIKAKRVK
jgi:hypothetical protein